MATQVFGIYDSAGNPLPSESPTWLGAWEAATGAALAANPTITQLSSGLYKFTRDNTDMAGMIDMGASATPRHVLVRAMAYPVFAAFDLNFQPKTGLSPTWNTLVKVSDGSNYTPQMTFTELGQGVYRVNAQADPDEHVAGEIDLGSGHYPRYLIYDSEAIAISPSRRLHALGVFRIPRATGVVRTS